MIAPTAIFNFFACLGKDVGPPPDERKLTRLVGLRRFPWLNRRHTPTKIASPTSPIPSCQRLLTIIGPLRWFSRDSPDNLPLTTIVGLFDDCIAVPGNRQALSQLQQAGIRPPSGRDAARTGLQPGFRGRERQTISVPPPPSAISSRAAVIPACGGQPPGRAFDVDAGRGAAATHRGHEVGPATPHEHRPAEGPAEGGGGDGRLTRDALLALRPPGSAQATPEGPAHGLPVNKNAKNSGHYPNAAGPVDTPVLMGQLPPALLSSEGGIHRTKPCSKTCTLPAFRG